MWRKTRIPLDIDYIIIQQPKNKTTRVTCTGADINRNFNISWRSPRESVLLTGTPCNEVYPGWCSVDTLLMNI